jgi:hypothetical protein
LVRGPEYLLAHGKVATYMGIGTAVIAAGLIGGLHFIQSGHSPASAADGAAPLLPAQPKSDDASVAGVGSVNTGEREFGTTVLGVGGDHKLSGPSTSLNTIGTAPAEAHKGLVTHPLFSSPVQEHPAVKPVHSADTKKAVTPRDEHQAPALSPSHSQVEPQAEAQPPAAPQLQRKAEPQSEPRTEPQSEPGTEPRKEPRTASGAGSQADPQAQSHAPARPQPPTKHRAPAQPAGKVHLGLADLTFAEGGGLLGTGLSIDPPTNG